MCCPTVKKKKKKQPFAIICIGNFISFYHFLNLKVETNQNLLTQVVCVCVCVRARGQSLSRVPVFATPWTVAYQVPLSMGFSRQEFWSGLPFPTPLFHMVLLNTIYHLSMFTSLAYCEDLIVVLNAWFYFLLQFSADLNIEAWSKKS